MNNLQYITERMGKQWFICNCGQQPHYDHCAVIRNPTYSPEFFFEVWKFMRKDKLSFAEFCDYVRSKRICCITHDFCELTDDIKRFIDAVANYLKGRG